MERHGSCFGAPTTNLDGQLAKNWQIKERYRVKFAMDFFDLLNHPNFNSNALKARDTLRGPPPAVQLQRPVKPKQACNRPESSN